MDKYNPEVGEIWWFGTSRKHFLFLDKHKPEVEYLSYTWRYKLYCLETGDFDYILHGNMNAHGEGWFRRIS